MTANPQYYLLMKTFLRLMFSAPFMLAITAGILQAGAFFAVIYFFINAPLIGIAVYLSQGVICFLTCIVVINCEDSAEYKLSWCAAIFVLPLLFSALYFIAGRKRGNKCKKQPQKTERSAHSLENLNSCERALSGYIESVCGGSIRNAEGFEYYKSGEEFFEAVFAALEKAQKYIFIEFYSFERGFLFRRLVNILRQKVNEGVEVKMIYDGIGCAGKLTGRIKKILRSYGIELKVFNPVNCRFNPGILTHRKIVCADGQTAFTGGVNVGDMYVNIVNPYGQWRDSGAKIEGCAAQDFALMFLKLWHRDSKTDSFDRYIKRTDSLICNAADECLIQPFSDSPYLPSRVSKNVFLSLIRGAENYLYISTPYLLPDNELLSAIIFKAESGCDVRILTPHIPDKKMIFSMTRSFYYCLINAGVKIYEYTPGFNHAKAAICDGRTAYIGSCNLNHHSLYFQHECGALLYGEKITAPLEKDFINTLEACEQITKQKAEGTVFSRFFRSILRFFSPLF